MRAIDADALIDKYGEWYTEEGPEVGYIGTIKGIVNKMPTIEPETTTWTEKEAIYIDEPHPIIEAWQSMRCSKCERYYTTPYAYYLDEPNYCPHCGRKTERRTDD